MKQKDILNPGTTRSRESEGATQLWAMLSRASRAIARNAEAGLEGLGIGLTDFAVMELLLNQGPQSINELGRSVLLTSGSISTAVDRLERRGLVVRKQDPEDGRGRIADLTSAGRRVILPACERHEGDMEETMSVLKPAERVELGRLLRKVGLSAEARVGGRNQRAAQGHQEEIE